MRYKNWTEQEIDILKQNYGKISRKDLIKLLPNKNIKPTSITRYAWKLGLHGNMSIGRRLYSFNEHYFDKPNIENCYWAGFIAADGCLMNKSYGMQISLSIKDKCILENFKKHIDFSGPISERIRTDKKTGSVFNYCNISIWCANQWHNKLLEHWNITQNKTYTLIPPNNYIKNQLAYAFLIGFFDGDGCWREYNMNGYRKYSFGLSGTQPMMEWCKYQLNNLVPEDKFINIPKRGNYWVYQACGQRAVKIKEQLNSIVDIPWKLERKWKN